MEWRVWAYWPETTSGRAFRAGCGAHWTALVGGRFWGVLQPRLVALRAALPPASVQPLIARWTAKARWYAGRASPWVMQ